jgi:hypothetical protein
VDAKRHRFVDWGRKQVPEAEMERLNLATAGTPQRTGWRGLVDRWRRDYERLWFRS